MTSVIRYIQLLLFAGILIVACEDDSISPDTNTDGNDTTKVDSSKIDSCLTDSCITSDSIKAAIGAEPFEIYLELLAMYRNSCVSCLEQFLGNWAKKFPPRMDVHDSVKAVYEIFYEFYTPGDLNRIGDSEWGPDIYKDLSYYVIQNEITYSYSFQSTETGGSARYVIEDFRPAISNNNVTPIYLTEELEAGVAAFLGAHISFGDNMWVEVLSSTEKARRYEFLNNYLKFFVGHWGNYWHMETHPHAGIELTKDLDSAFVRFRLGYQGGTALVVNTDEGWDLIHSELTWIE